SDSKSRVVFATICFRTASIRTASGWGFFAPTTRVSTQEKTNESAGGGRWLHWKTPPAKPEGSGSQRHCIGRGGCPAASNCDRRAGDFLLRPVERGSRLDA